MDNFFSSVMGWWKMAISHLKHSYLNWRVIPCKRKTICVYHNFFQHFFWTWLSWLLFRLIKFFKCMIWQSFSFFVHFFFFSFSWSCLFRATTHVIDNLSDWSITSDERIVLKRVGFWSKVVRTSSVQKRIMAQKVFPKNSQFWSTCPRH